jgi:hypothetical protein
LLEHHRWNFPKLNHLEMEVMDDLTVGKRPFIQRLGYYSIEKS